MKTIRELGLLVFDNFKLLGSIILFHRLGIYVTEAK